MNIYLLVDIQHEVYGRKTLAGPEVEEAVTDCLEISSGVDHLIVNADTLHFLSVLRRGLF
jgi:hypothetical protein